MQLIANGTQVASIPTPVTPTGTPGYINNEAPGPSVTPTIIDPDANNALFAEVANAVLASGQTLTAGVFTQLTAAIRALAGLSNHGQCVLSAASGTSLLLSPMNGRGIIIDGVGYQIPQAGVSIGNAGLANSTLYYVYLYNNAGTLTLELSATAYATDTTAANYGIVIKSGDPTRTLVGLIATTASGTLADSGNQRLVASWFNQKSKTGLGQFTANHTNSSTPYAEINSELRVQFVTFAGREVNFYATGEVANNTANESTFTGLNIDGTVQNEQSSNYSSSANLGDGLNIQARKTIAEGLHYATLSGSVTAGTASTYYSTYPFIGAGASVPGVGVSLEVSISG